MPNLISFRLVIAWMSQMVSDYMPALASANQYPHHHFQNHGLINAYWQSWHWQWIVFQHQETLQLPITNGVGDQLNWLRDNITAKLEKHSFPQQTKFCPYLNTTWNINLIQDIWFQVFRIYAVEPDSWFHQLEDTKKGRRLPALLYPSPSVIIILMGRTRQ